jgi:hypothetical protein
MRETLIEYKTGKIVESYSEVLPGMCVISTDKKDEKGPLFVLYPCSMHDTRILVADEDGHKSLIQVDNGKYRHYETGYRKYRFVYGVDTANGPYYVTDDFYWDEDDFRRKHQDKAYGFVMKLEQLSKICFDKKPTRGRIKK